MRFLYCWRRFFVVAFTTSSFLCCLPPIHRSMLPEIDPRSDPDTVQVRFLGVGGFYIRKGEDAILTAPLYSNPEGVRLLNQPIPPDVSRIDRFHPNAANVKAILVGHAHYDHLMDVPYVWQRTPEAIIYGNRSMKYLLAGYAGASGQGSGIPSIPPGKVVALNQEGANAVDYRMCQLSGSPEEDPDCPKKTAAAGSWVYVPNSKVRIRALCSQHPPQFLGVIHLWTGCVPAPLESAPEKAGEYQEGETLAYLIDFMDADNQTPIYRIYYQDAATNPTIGQVPPQLLAEKAVDLALLCVGSFETVQDPAHIVANTKPSAVILGHWENFFRPQDKPLKGIPFSNVKRFIRLVKAQAPEDTQVYLPAPQTLFHFLPISRPNNR